MTLTLVPPPPRYWRELTREMENLLLIPGSTGEFDFDDLLYCFKHDRTSPRSDSQIFNQEFIKIC